MRRLCGQVPQSVVVEWLFRQDRLVLGYRCRHQTVHHLCLREFGNHAQIEFEGIFGGLQSNDYLVAREDAYGLCQQTTEVVGGTPEYTVFLLVSEEPDALLPTILSRVQHIKVPPLQEEEIAEALVEREGADVSLAADYAHIANGSYLRARKLLQSTEESRSDFESFVAIMRIAYRVGQKGDYSALAEMRKWCDLMVTGTGRERQKRFLQYMQQEIRENFIRNYGVDEANYQTGEERSFSVRFAPFINEANVERMMEAVQLAQQQIEQNGNAKIILFDMCLQLMVLLKR